MFCFIIDQKEEMEDRFKILMVDEIRKAECEFFELSVDSIDVLDDKSVAVAQ